MRPTALAIVVLLGLVLSGCGFQLRGASSVPAAIQPLAFECARSVPERLCRAVENQLELGEVRTASADSATAILRLSGFRQERRANAVTARGAAAEYTLSQSLGVEVITGDQIPLLATERVSSSETYRYDETNVLAKRQEEETLQMDLADRLAQQILFRLTPLNQTRVDAIRAQP